MNQDESYPEHVQCLFEHLEEAQRAGYFSIDYQRIQKYEQFTQFFVSRYVAGETVELKIDMVNDVAAHFGEHVQDEKLGQLDNWRNILSNKLAAIFRFEPKDVVDVWIIARHRAFHWQELIQEAKAKELGVEPVALYQILTSFPTKELSVIKWVKPVDTEIFKQELHQIAHDIFHGTENTLAENTL